LASKRSPIKNPGEIYTQTHKGAWAGLLVRKEETVTEQIVFESSMLGFREIPTGQYRVFLEYCTPTDQKWRRIREFEFLLDEWMKGQMEGGGSFTLGATTGDRSWPDDWKDTKKLILDEEVEQKLGLD
jgi:hypothetical protein